MYETRDGMRYHTRFGAALDQYLHGPLEQIREEDSLLVKALIGFNCLVAAPFLLPDWYDLSNFKKHEVEIS